MYRVIFCGTPQFAVPSLSALLSDDRIEVLGVMTQPDRPSGRGQKLMPSPIKQLALAHNLTVMQPNRLRKEPDMIAWLRDHQPDFIVTAAFGQILSQEVLDIPKWGTVNVHASLLPAYRGANPVQWAILNGDTQTGITTMLTALEVDAGPMLKQATIDIEPNETMGELVERLAAAGGTILVDSLAELAEGRLTPQEQDVSRATHAPKLTKEDAVINWNQPALAIHNRIRGQQPWPGAVTTLPDLAFDLKINASMHPKLINDKTSKRSSTPGMLVDITPEGIWVQAADEPLLITMVQPPNKPKMLARDWANGALRTISLPAAFCAV